MHLIRLGGISLNQTPLDWDGNRVGLGRSAARYVVCNLYSMNVSPPALLLHPRVARDGPFPRSYPVPLVCRVLGEGATPYGGQSRAFFSLTPVRPWTEQARLS